MQLKEGVSVWQGQGTSAAIGQGPLQNDTDCEVAIIGGGITGALVAEHLVRAGVNVIALDRRAPSHGSTAASTGLIQYELDTTLLELIDKRGKSEAMAGYRLCADVLDDFPEYLKAAHIDCDVQKYESLYLASHDSELPTFEQETQARQGCGINTRFIGAHELYERFAIQRPAAIWSPGSLAIDPYKVATQLWQKSLAAGLRLHTPVQVTGYDADASGVTLHTEGGANVRARKVVFATGYETPSFLKVEVAISTTYALASQPDLKRPGTRPNCLVWESARPYLYIRTGPQNSLIVGGEDEPWHGQPLSPEKRRQKTEKLIEKMGKLYPQLEIEPAFEWSGLFAQTPDGLPYIGQTPQFPHGFFALGYGGNGILFSYIAARIIQDLFTGSLNKHVGLFRFER